MKSLFKLLISYSIIIGALCTHGMADLVMPKWHNAHEKTAAKNYLMNYIKTAQATNSIAHVAHALATYKAVFNEKVPLAQLVAAKKDAFTPTLAHLYVEQPSIGDNAHEYYPHAYYLGNKSLEELIQTVVELENNSLEHYYSYVHAHTWPLDLAQRIYTELCPLKNPEFFPIHFLTLSNPPTDESALIALLHNKGAAETSSWEKYLLSVNTAFFGNSGDAGESTAYYLRYNTSQDSPDLWKLFKGLRHVDLYKKHAVALEQLQQLHAQASHYGKLWFIMIPKGCHKKVVIPTVAYGYKTKIIIDGKPTDDVNYIQDTLRTRPEAIENLDALQFRILMTPSTGLNPNLGIKTIPLHCADPVKYAEFEKAFHELMTKVKADIAAKKF